MVDSGLIKKIVGEACGTLALLLIGLGTQIEYGDIMKNGDDTYKVSLGFAFAYACTYYLFRDFSGSHFNPAISLASLLAGTIDVMDFVIYIIAQAVGAAIACLFIALFFDYRQTSASWRQYGSNLFGHKGNYWLYERDYQKNYYTYFDTEWWAALIAEFLMTFYFVYTFMVVTNNDEQSRASGLVMAMAYIMVIHMGYRFTFASVNPWRSLFPAIFKLHDPIKKVWVFLVGPFVGGLVAGVVYKLFNGK